MDDKETTEIIFLRSVTGDSDLRTEKGETAVRYLKGRKCCRRQDWFIDVKQIENSVNQ